MVWIPIAIVLITTELGAENDVINDLKRIDGVIEAFAVYGVYDVIAKLKAKSMVNLREIILRCIRKSEKIRSTLTTIKIE